MVAFEFHDSIMDIIVVSFKFPMIDSSLFIVDFCNLRKKKVK
jgi:hypothetical protein